MKPKIYSELKAILEEPFTNGWNNTIEKKIADISKLVVESANKDMTREQYEEMRGATTGWNLMRNQIIQDWKVGEKSHEKQ